MITEQLNRFGRGRAKRHPLRRGRGQRRPLSLALALALLDQRFPRRRADLTLFYRALMGQSAPQQSRQHATWYRTVGRYIHGGRRWMKTDPYWRRIAAQAKKPALRARKEAHHDPIEAYYGVQMPVFDGETARVISLPASYKDLLEQNFAIQYEGQRFLDRLAAETGTAPPKPGG